MYCSSLPVERLLNQTTPRRQRENTVPPSTRSASQPESDEDEIIRWVNIRTIGEWSEEWGELNRCGDTSSRRQAGTWWDRKLRVTSGRKPRCIRIDEEQPTIPPPVIENSTIPPPPMENTRPSRIRNPPPRLNYWTPGNPITGISYPGCMNAILVS